MLATKSDLAEIYDNELSCYALECKESLVPTEDISSSLSPSVSNLVQEKKINNTIDEEKENMDQDEIYYISFYRLKYPLIPSFL